MDELSVYSDEEKNVNLNMYIPIVSGQAASSAVVSKVKNEIWNFPNITV